MITKLKLLIWRSLYKISFFIKKNKSIWLFGAWQGKLYSDNTKYMFEYVNKNHPEITAVWITHNTAVRNSIRNKGYRAYGDRSILGIYYAMRAAAVFETEGNQDIGMGPIGGAEVIQLWHGAGPKKCSWNNGVKQVDQRRHGIDNFHEESWWMCTSPWYINHFETMPLFVKPLNRDKMLLTGYPRNDSFVNCPDSEFINNYNKYHAGKKLIVYMPTHRNFGKEELPEELSIDTLKKVNEFLNRNDYYMLYKPHFHEMQKYQGIQFERVLDHIILANDSELYGDPYEYLHACDLIISDYSSVLYDFICSGKPAILFPFDLEEYNTNDAGIEDFYTEVPAGPICYTWEAVFEEVNNLFQCDIWKDQRNKARHLLHSYTDGKNCERVYNSVIKILSGELS
ncbi:MAG: hypothetical protein HFI75_15565 [Lachnospiraceae bacterium]|nr:hypothetical protein [Lachnospiraceae bacterium]